MNHENQKAVLEKTLEIVEIIKTVETVMNAVREKKRTSTCCKKATN